MPPESRVPEIRGRIQRTYRVRDVAEIDAHLRRLRTWLADTIQRAPALTRRHIEFYGDDCDRLLDARVALKRRGDVAGISTELAASIAPDVARIQQGAM